jgi:hypothetical protein
MTRRGRRTAKQLENVSTADMTPAEYERSDIPGTFIVEAPGVRIKVSGMHSARAVAATYSDAVIKREGE